MPLLVLCIRLALVAYVIALIALYFMQDAMLLPATLYDAEPPTGHHAGYDVEPWYASGQYAGYVVTPTAGKPRGTFVVYHGNAESAENKLPLAEVFLHAGYRVVLAEYPGHGKREGSRTMKAALNASRGALAAVREQWNGHVYLVGESLGAGMVAQVIRGNESTVAGVVLITPWDTLASVAAETLWIFPVRWMLHDPFDSISALAHYASPVVVIGAQEDTLIPVAHARALASAHPGAHLMLLTDANHDDWFDAMTRERWQQVLLWSGAG
jgi:alpha-beta hydrolase superfamily lysophospholipase